MMPFNSKDVFLEAINVIEEEKIFEPCFDNCLWCAVATAKGILDDRYGVQRLPLKKILDDLTFGIVEVDSDAPLVEARDILNKKYKNLYGNPLSKKQAIKYIKLLLKD